MLSESQIAEVLSSLTLKGATYEYHTNDRDIYTSFEDVRPYVLGFKQKMRGFACQGLSLTGKDLLESK